MEKNHQLIIIGGGPAGLCAGIYAARAKLDTLLMEKSGLGGRILNAELVENYPGFPNGISGADLGTLMAEQTTKYNLQTVYAEVERLEIKGTEKIVHTTDGVYRTKALIIAGGSEHKKLGVPGEDQFVGKGVSYCATCDGAFFRDQVIAVIGGGNSALNEALFLTRFGSKVIVVHRRDQLRATKILQERAFANPKIEFIWNTEVTAIAGDKFVREITLRDCKSGNKSKLMATGIFVAVGLSPSTGYLKSILKLDEWGFVPVNERMETEVPGLFAAGDIRSGSIRQVVAATGDGAIAAVAAERYLSAM